MAVSATDAKDWARETLVGQWFAPLGPVTTDDQIDEAGIAEVVERGLALRIGGLAYSSLFEPWSSTHEERRRALEVFMAAVDGRMPVYATVTDHSIKETIMLGQHAIDSGAAVLMIGCPYEHAKSPVQIKDFYEYVCERLRAPIALYNTPHAGAIFSPELIAELASIENVCAIKNAIGDFEHSSRLFELVGDRIVVSDPTERNFLRNIVQNGQRVLFSTTATHLLQSPAWQPIDAYAVAAADGRLDEAQRLFDEIEPLRAVWDSLYSVLWGEHSGPAQHPIAATKYWQELMGYPAGPPRPPLQPLTHDDKQHLRDRLIATGLTERFELEAF